MMTGPAAEDDLDILATNYVPDAAESLAIRTRLESRNEEIRFLDAMVEALKSPEVHMRCKNLRKLCAVAVTLLAPIRRIPEEIMGDIFILAVPGLQYLTAGNNFSPMQPGEPHPHDVRWRLCQVCRRWTRIMRNTPNVWATVSLDRHLPSDISVVSRYLQKSKACPLDVYLNPYQWSPKVRYGSVHAMLQLIHREVPRLRRLIAFRPVHQLLIAIFPTIISTNAPLLEVLQFRTMGWDGRGGTPGPIYAPNLEILDVSNAHTMMSFAGTPLLRLRQLLLQSISQISTAAFLQFLMNCPNIEVLRLPRQWQEVGDTVDPQTPWPSEHVALLSLKELRFAVHDSIDSARFCEILYMPELELLDVVVEVNGSAIGRLESLLAGAFASIRHLTVSGPPNAVSVASLTGSSVGAFLERLVNLESLRMSWGTLDEAFFSALTPEVLASPAALTCPRLIVLEFSDVTFPGEHLLRLVRTRTRPDAEEILPGYITLIRLVSCPGLKGHQVSELVQLKRTHGKTLRF